MVRQNGDANEKSSIFICIVTVADNQFVGGEENQEPVVTNPIAKQLDYEHVLISHQVEDGDGDLMTVSVKVSDDGGRRFGFTVPLEQLSGDVGEGVSSGKGEEIVWTIAVDKFLHIYGENFVIRVLTDDGVKPVWGEKITWDNYEKLTEAVTNKTQTQPFEQLKVYDS